MIVWIHSFAILGLVALMGWMLGMLLADRAEIDRLRRDTEILHRRLSLRRLSPAELAKHQAMTNVDAFEGPPQKHTDIRS